MNPLTGKPYTDLELQELELDRIINATRHQFGQPERVALIRRRNELRNTNIALSRKAAERAQ